MPSRSSGSRQRPRRPSPKAQRQQQKHEEQERNEQEESEPSRREKRVNRRRDAVDNAVDELAMGTAENLSSEAGQGMIQLRNIGLKVLESKAEKDPEWYFELADRLDIDPIELLEPSEARKEEIQKEQAGSQPAVDSEIDDAVPGDSSPSSQEGTPEREQVRTKQQETTEEQSFGGSAEEWPGDTETGKYDNQEQESVDTISEVEEQIDEGEDEGEDMFEEVFGE
jgi:hypothetical protein